MEDRILRNVRVLIVEDQPAQLAGFKHYLNTIDEALRLDWGINAFQPSPAETVEEAERLIQEAKLPFDILILDLGLPRRRGDKDDPVNGKNFLESLNKEIVKEVIIVSVTKDYEYVIKAVRKGAVDFIGKPFKAELLRARVLDSWKRVLEKDSDRLHHERIKELVHYNERGLAYRHNVCFGNFANDVLSRTTKLQNHVYDRYGLSRTRDTQDGLIQSLAGFEDSVSAARRAWMELRVPSLLQEEERTTETIETTLREIAHSLLPSLVVKKAKLDIPSSTETKMLTYLSNVTFQSDARAILKEILFGALAELPDYDSPNAKTDRSEPNLIRIEISTDKGHACVRFSDNLGVISPDDAERINTGSFSVSGDRFSRVWGLAVMQHIAALGGGRLIVEPHQGNNITLLIPLDNHA